jgi:heme/copper-type cytochrome/quinol oxidase subunit 2
VDPFPDPLLLRKSGSAGNRTRTSGSVARNFDHQTKEAVIDGIIIIIIIIVIIIIIIIIIIVIPLWP